MMPTTFSTKIFKQFIIILLDILIYKKIFLNVIKALKIGHPC